MVPHPIPKKKVSFTPNAKPSTSKPLRVAGKTTPKHAAPRPAENMFVEDMTSMKKHAGTVYENERFTFSRSLQEVPDSVNAVRSQV